MFQSVAISIYLLYRTGNVRKIQNIWSYLLKTYPVKCLSHYFYESVKYQMIFSSKFVLSFLREIIILQIEKRAYF